MNKEFQVTPAEVRKSCDVWTRASKVKTDSPIQEDACALHRNYKQFDFWKKFYVLNDSDQDAMIAQQLRNFWAWIHGRVLDGDWGEPDSGRGPRKYSFEFHKEENSHRGAIHIDVFVTEHAPLSPDSPEAGKYAKLYHRLVKPPVRNSTWQLDRMERGDLALQIDEDYSGNNNDDYERDSGNLSEGGGPLDLSGYRRSDSSCSDSAAAAGRVREPTLNATNYPLCGGEDGFFASSSSSTRNF